VQAKGAIVGNTEPSDWATDAHLAVRVVAMRRDTNAAGDIFGGWVAAQMDLAASTAAEGFAGCKCVTVAINGMVFHHPMAVGDELNVYTRIVKVGRTSITICAESVRRIRRTNIRQKVTSGNFVFVAVDDAGRPQILDKEWPMAEQKAQAEN
jgi:acyl-CoA thioesterase YciA